MNIQIIGTKRDSDTRKAERFFRDRRIGYQFRDLGERGLTPGELTNITDSVDAAELIDRESSAYKRRGMQYLEYDPEEEILSEPLLVRMPIVRSGKNVTIGYDPDAWLSWLAEAGTQR